MDIRHHLHHDRSVHVVIRVIIRRVTNKWNLTKEEEKAKKIDEIESNVWRTHHNTWRESSLGVLLLRNRTPPLDWVLARSWSSFRREKSISLIDFNPTTQLAVPYLFKVEDITTHYAWYCHIWQGVIFNILNANISGGILYTQGWRVRWRCIFYRPIYGPISMAVVSEKCDVWTLIERQWLVILYVICFSLPYLTQPCLTSFSPNRVSSCL